MRLKPVLLILLAVFLAAAASLALSLRSGLSLGFASTFIESRASEFLNRKISLKKAPQLRLSDGLHIALAEVALADADWAGEGPMLTVNALKAEIDFWSLFDEQILVNQLHIDGLNLHLHRDRDGRSNIPGLDRDQKNTTTKEPPSGLLPVLLEHMTIRNVQVRQSNEQSGKSLNLRVDSLTQDSHEEEGLRLRGQGSLQDYPWQLAVDSSDLMSLRTGIDMSADVKGSLGDLNLEGNYQLPDLTELQNLSLTAILSGPMPPRVAELSPILEAQAPTKISLEVRDVTPGLEVSLIAEMPHLMAQATGTIDDPAAADGVALDVILDADSLPRLAQHFGLDVVGEVPVSLRGQLLRRGDRVEFRDGIMDAGSNHLEANVLMPAFPGTNGASVQLSAAGNDFSLYQTLLKQEPNLKHPYSIALAIDDISEGGERVNGDFRVGEHTLQLSGLLDNFPSYAGSQLQLTFFSPRLEELAAAADIEIPPTPLDLRSELGVADDGVIAIRSTNITAYTTELALSGRLNGYPDFDDADIRFRADAGSLAELGARFGLDPLGDVPVQLDATLTGRPDKLVLKSPSLTAGGFELQGISGGLRLEDGALSSDLLVSGKLAELATLLGSYAPDHLPEGSYAFSLRPTLSSELFSLALEDLAGPGLRGSARLELSRDFTLDENTLLESTLRLEDLSALLPPVEGYQPAPHPLTLTAITRPTKAGTTINAQLLDDDAPKLSVEIVVPSEKEDEGITIAVRGAGSDVGRLGKLSFLPEEQLSYAIDLDATVLGKTLTVDAREFSLGASRVRGSAIWDSGNNALEARLEVPSADLQAWIPPENASGEEPAAPVSGDGRRIPDLELPLAWLHDYQIDLILETGNLGLRDPEFSDKALIEAASLRLQSGEGRGLFNINQLQGSRGELSSRLEIDDRGETTRLVSDLKVSDFPLGIVAAGSFSDALPRYDLSSSFTGEGRDLRSIAASLDGELLMVGGAGRLEKMKLSVATESFVAQVLQTLLPMIVKGSTDMAVECAVLAARAKKGILNLDPGFVFRSKEVELTAYGQINLSNEKLSIDFNNRAREGLGISAASVINPFVAVSGTLAKPKLGLDITKSAISGGAAFATAGATIIAKPLFDRVFKRGDTCKAAIALWNESME
ncbi:AsmA family protein [Congregibacter litoralis]|uniref:Uncharacterized protein involved in outer membrane biogenesis n=1 Tax=Congregibacter litoralis KT71 TaxID=314285 RepID=A4ACF9_9GAMM|nr:AsmA family protein [Congregibacter litoralis]EAQ96387.1 Uncharacterized protein involved in outer membrane biogenesis [Congregibacter litoralis KT71]